jgi:hypothetical protein
VASGAEALEARAPARAGTRPGSLSGLRILEIGDVAMFKQGVPSVTELVWTGVHDDIEGVGAPTAFGLRRLPALRRALDRAEFDLVVGHPPAAVPWQPGRVAALVRRFKRRAPAMFVRSLGVRLLLRPTRTPVAILDLGDLPIIRPHNFALLDRARIYFKRELPADRSKVFAGSADRGSTTPQPASPRLAGWCAKLSPISLAVSPARAADIASATTPSPEKIVDVFFAGRVASSPSRAAGLPELRALARDGVRIDLPTERLDRREFYRRCARAWITWSPEGYGWDCFRHYEAGLCESVPLMNRPSIVRHAPLRAGEHALYYELLPGDLARTARAALEDRAGLGRMATAARDHVLRYHTLERLCQHVVRSCLTGAGMPGAESPQAAVAPARAVPE